ncbi:MAG: hypothetical protein HYV07_21735 [Deltaproteobacteria bacterium]|nr:hypothetical protein [Deltaproteobacteria bacterium]
MRLTTRVFEGCALALCLCACPDRGIDAAKDLEQAGKLDEAAEAYRELAKNEPNNLAAWDRAVDLTCVKLVKIDACAQLLDVELELLGSIARHRDALSTSLESRARARMEQGLPDAALLDLDRAQKASPWRASVHAARAKVHAMLGHRASAEADIKKAKEIDPTLAEGDALAFELPDPDPEPGFGGTSTAP